MTITTNNITNPTETASASRLYFKRADELKAGDASYANGAVVEEVSVYSNFVHVYFRTDEGVFNETLDRDHLVGLKG